MHNRQSAILLLMFTVCGLGAADRLAPGVHEVPTSLEGITCTLVVPSAVNEGKPLPLVVLMAYDGKPETKRWADWSAGSGFAVMGINGLVSTPPLLNEGTPPVNDPVGTKPLGERTRKAYVAALEVTRQRLPIHPLFRYLVAVNAAPETPPAPVAAGQQAPVLPGAIDSEQIIALLEDRQQPFGGVLAAGGFAQVRKDVPILYLRGTTGERATQVNSSPTTPAKPGAAPKPDGPPIHSLWVGKVDRWFSLDQVTGGMSLLQDFASVTHERLTTTERRDNLDLVAARIQEIAGLVNPIARRAYAQFFSTIPGMDKRRRDYERLSDIWLETSIIIAREHEKENLPEAHAYLSVVVRSERFKVASGKQRKAAQDELARMRKDPAIKKEQAAADILADTLAMLEHDDSTAKQRIALKDLEAMVAKYPATLAGKEAAKLLETLRSNVR